MLNIVKEQISIDKVEIIQTKNKVALETFRENDMMTKIKEHFGIIDGKKTVEKLTFKH